TNRPATKPRLFWHAARDFAVARTVPRRRWAAPNRRFDQRIGLTQSFGEALRRTGPSTLRRRSHGDRDRAGPRLAKQVPVAYPGDAPQPYFAGGVVPEFVAEVVRPVADSLAK